jgi:hypothetical protein
MAEIKINQLNIEKTPEIVDLKAEAAQGNAAAIVAFKSLRGGLAARKACWCVQHVF